MAKRCDTHALSYSCVCDPTSAVLWERSHFARLVRTDASRQTEQMSSLSPLPGSPLQLGGIEPHAGLLVQPPADQLLYKLMSIENLLRSIDGAYLHFTRVDQYSDSPVADPHDGRQLPADLVGNARSRFQNAPEFSAADYYERSRARTYACCFGLENADYLWRNYGGGSEHGKVCVVFRFGKLRESLNRSIAPDKARLIFDGLVCEQVMSLNYGIVEYVAWDEHQANEKNLPNPIVYSYLKDKRFSAEQELRATLSAPGIFAGFRLADGRMLGFPSSLQAPFDFRAALADGAIVQLLLAPESDGAFLRAELAHRRIGLAPGSDEPPPVGPPADGPA